MRHLSHNPLSIAKILDAGIKLYAAGFPKLIGLILLAGAVHIVESLPLEMMPEENPAAAADDPVQILAKLPYLFLYIVLSTNLPQPLYAAMITRFDNLEHQRHDSFSQALSQGFKMLPSLLLAANLYLLSLGLGLVLLIGPGIYLSLTLSFYAYFIVLEKQGGLAALKSSQRLVSGHWWRTSLVLTVPLIIIVIPFLLIDTIEAALELKNNMPIEAARNFLSGFIDPFLWAIGYVQYHDLKTRKSGGDLERRLG